MQLLFTYLLFIYISITSLSLQKKIHSALVDVTFLHPPLSATTYPPSKVSVLYCVLPDLHTFPKMLHLSHSLALRSMNRQADKTKFISIYFVYLITSC